MNPKEVATDFVKWVWSCVEFLVVFGVIGSIIVELLK